MKIKTEKVPIAFETRITMTALQPEWVQLRDVIQENINFYPDLRPLLDELNIALEGWSAPITGICGSQGLSLKDGLIGPIGSTSRIIQDTVPDKIEGFR